GSFSLDLSGLSAGVYLVRLDTATHTATRKLVVQR
ncbi:MAG: T9SS type A sorting domain-containing protein, partial [candidate division WOR-3 bacterium]